MSGPTAAEALERLREGNRRFVDGRLTVDMARPHGAPQEPFAAVMSCSDSRVPSEILFDQTPGSLFVVRSAGAVVDSLAQASLRFAVKHLGVPLVLVAGHTDCGAVTAALGVAGGGEVPAGLEPIIGPLLADIHGPVSIDEGAMQSARASRDRVRLLLHDVEVVAGIVDVSSGALTLADD